MASKKGKKKQAPFIQGLLVFGANSHFGKTSRRANDNGVVLAQEEFSGTPAPLASESRLSLSCLSANAV